MKRNILHFLISLLLFMAVDAQAQECCGDGSFWYGDNACVDETNFYAKILSGANFLENTTADGNSATYQTGYLITGVLGYCWRYGLCLEAEYSYRETAIRDIQFFVEGSSKSGNFQSSSFMANLVWDLPLSLWECEFWNVQPFIGAGVGYDEQEMHSSNSRIIFDQNWNQFSWQLMAGLAYPICCNAEVTLEYKFHQGGGHFNSNSIGVGLVYKFGYLR